jgi:ribosome recycling factor
VNAEGERIVAKDKGKDKSPAPDAPESLDEVTEETLLNMMTAVESLENKFRTVRTGRASPALVEHVKVKAYDTESPLRQVAGIAVPEPRLIMLRPYDPGIIADIEKAIIAADLGLNPQNDGKVVRIPIPPLTEERRRDLVKVVEREAENARIAVRNARRDANKVIDALKKGGSFPEDDCARAKETVQEHTNDQEKEITDRLEKKREEIMEV